MVDNGIFEKEFNGVAFKYSTIALSNGTNPICGKTVADRISGGRGIRRGMIGAGGRMYSDNYNSP